MPARRVAGAIAIYLAVWIVVGLNAIGPLSVLMISPNATYPRQVPSDVVVIVVVAGVVFVAGLVLVVRRARSGPDDPRS